MAAPQLPGETGRLFWEVNSCEKDGCLNSKTLSFCLRMFAFFVFFFVYHLFAFFCFIYLFSLVGFTGNLSLLERCLFFARGA